MNVLVLEGSSSFNTLNLWTYYYVEIHMLLTSVIACIQCICVLPKCQITLQGSWKVSAICRGPNKAEKKTNNVRTLSNWSSTRNMLQVPCLLSHVPTIFPRLLKSFNHLHLVYISCLCINIQLAHEHIMKSG